MLAQKPTEPPAPAPSAFGQGARFAVVGLGSALGYVLVSTLILHAQTGVPDWAVSALCYAAFVGPAYLAHRRFAFSSLARHGRAFPRYVAVQLWAVVFAALLSVLAYAVLGLPPIAGSIAIAGTVSVSSFVLSRFWVFAGRAEAAA